MCLFWLTLYFIFYCQFFGGLENDPAEKEERLERKINPKPRLSLKRAAQNKSSPATNSTADSKTSKYFQSLPKEEVNSEDDFEMLTAAPAAVKKSTKKPEEEEKEEEEDDSEDEDDWEEVEGKPEKSEILWCELMGGKLI